MNLLQYNMRHNALQQGADDSQLPLLITAVKLKALDPVRLCTVLDKQRKSGLATVIESSTGDLSKVFSSLYMVSRV